MRRRSADFYSSLPNGRLSLGKLLWVFVAFGCVTLVCLGVYTVLMVPSVPSRHSFTGTLRPVAAPVSVTLPKGAFLKEILIDRNEQVYAGQTVALLDSAAMETEIDALDGQLLHDDWLRECLLFSQNPGQSPQEAHGFTEVQLAAIQDAEASCAVSRTAFEDVKRGFDEAIALMKSDETLLDNLLRLKMSDLDADDADNRQENLRHVLSLQLAQNKLLERKLTLERNHQQEMSDLSAAKAARLAKLSESLAKNAALRRRLLSLLEAPRLLAPEDGQVVRLRHFPVGSTAQEDTAFLEIRPSDSQGYQAEFALPVAQRGFVEPGQTVFIHLLGMRDRIQRLSGVVSRFEIDNSGGVIALVELHAESAAELDAPANGIALRGDSTAAVIELRFPEYEALDVVRRELFKISSAFGLTELSGKFAVNLFEATRSKQHIP